MADETSIAFNSSPATTARYCYIFTDKAKGTKVFYTGADEDVTITNMPTEELGGTRTFTSVPVAHAGQKKSREFEEAGVQVMVPKNNTDFGNLFLSSITAEIRIAIIRLSSYADNPQLLEWGVDTKIITEGVVTNMTFDDDLAIADLVPEAYAQNFSVPRFWWTRTCNHVLFGTGCNVSPDTYAVDATVVAINRTNRTVTVEGRVNSTDFWAYGTMSHDITAVKISIVKATDVQTTRRKFFTNNWLPALQVGDGVKLLPGCRRTTSDCQNRFNNAQNFGGFWKVPTRDSVKHGV